MTEKQRFITTEIVSGFVHDLNNALSLLMLRMENLEDLMDSPDPEMLKAAYSQMEEAFEKLNKNVQHQAAPYQRPSTDNDRSVDLADFAVKLLGAVEHIGRVHGVELINEVTPGHKRPLILPKQLLESVVEVLGFLYDSKSEPSKKKLMLKNSDDVFLICDSNGQELSRL